MPSQIWIVTGKLPSGSEVVTVVRNSELLGMVDSDYKVHSIIADVDGLTDDQIIDKFKDGVFFARSLQSEKPEKPKEKPSQDQLIEALKDMVELANRQTALATRIIEAWER